MGDFPDIEKGVAYKKVCNSLTSRKLLHDFSFTIEILLKCIFHSIVLVDSANIYLFKVNKRNTQSLGRSNVFLVNSEHNSHHFLAFLLLNLNRKMFIGTAVSGYDPMSI